MSPDENGNYTAAEMTDKVKTGRELQRLNDIIEPMASDIKEIKTDMKSSDKTCKTHRKDQEASVRFLQAAVFVLTVLVIVSQDPAMLWKLVF